MKNPVGFADLHAGRLKLRSGGPVDCAVHAAARQRPIGGVDYDICAGSGNVADYGSEKGSFV